MIPEIRKQYNSEFSEKKYADFIKELNTSNKYPVDFRVSETPLFLTNDFSKKLIQASEEIISQISDKNFRVKMNEALPDEFIIPGEDENPLFLQIDFAVTKNADNEIVPKLIELQGFPSLYSYQYFLNKMYRKHFNIPQEMTTYFNNIDDNSYISIIKDAIIDDVDPQNVILMEIDPEKQKTRIDFACTEGLTGIKTVSLSEIIKRKNKLFYRENGKEIRIKRIYNRVIFDELKRKNIDFNFSFNDDLEIKWAGHPNWFFKISKFSLPFLYGDYVPDSIFLTETDKYPEDLKNYVLKPLFSFAGLGVEVEIDIEKINSIQNKENFILQKKIEYAPIIITPDINAKAEIRMMFIWKEKPLLVNNLVRMSKGKMMGVEFNREKTWVGSSVAYHF